MYLLSFPSAFFPSSTPLFSARSHLSHGLLVPILPCGPASHPRGQSHIPASTHHASSFPCSISLTSRPHTFVSPIGGSRLSASLPFLPHHDRCGLHHRRLTPRHPRCPTLPCYPSCPHHTKTGCPCPCLPNPSSRVIAISLSRCSAMNPKHHRSLSTPPSHAPPPFAPCHCKWPSWVRHRLLLLFVLFQSQTKTRRP